MRPTSCYDSVNRETTSWAHLSSSFYFLLAVLCVGLGSTLGSDDFLVAFGAGTAFGWGGWFASNTLKTKLPNVLDLLLSSSMFVYFGASIPWHSFTGDLDPGRLVGCWVLILLLRRIPVVLALKNWIPSIKTYSEALVAVHFGPMVVGARSSSPSKHGQDLRRRLHVFSLIHQSIHQINKPLIPCGPPYPSSSLAQSWSTVSPQRSSV
jgi:hypothetical protein